MTDVEDIVKTITDKDVRNSDFDYQKRYIENQILYNKPNYTLEDSDVFLIENWINIVSNSANYKVAYRNFLTCLEENYGDRLLTQHYLNKEKSTPLKAKIMFEEDMSLNKNYGKDFLEKFKEFALYEMALSLGMVSIYQKSNIPSDLLTLSYFSISLMFANYKLGIGRIISTESETLEFQIKKLIYAYKNNKISKEIFKKELYNLVNILNSHYKQDTEEKKLEKTR